jgi:pSer/pThr/pTyr-binding forkhead associated (FHA) protein
MEVKLVVIGGKNHGREIPITQEEFLIGRAEGCHLRPASDRVSRKHCAIRKHEGRITVIDLNSTNHTFVNDEQITAERELKNGDRLKVGMLEFEVQLTVSLGGKKKPKIHSIQEAAQRTAQTTAANEDDLDISGWLEDDEENSNNSPLSTDTLSIRDTRTLGDKTSDASTVHMPPAEEEKKKHPPKEEPKKSHKSGHYDFKKKPTSANTQSAADDTLRHFLSRKKT